MIHTWACVCICVYIVDRSICYVFFVCLFVRLLLWKRTGSPSLPTLLPSTRRQRERATCSPLQSRPVCLEDSQEDKAGLANPMSISSFARVMVLLYISLE